MPASSRSPSSTYWLSLETSNHGHGLNSCITSPSTRWGLSFAPRWQLAPCGAADTDALLGKPQHCRTHAADDPDRRLRAISTRCCDSWSTKRRGSRTAQAYGITESDCPQRTSKRQRMTVLRCRASLERVVVEVRDVGRLAVANVIVVQEPLAEPLHALRERHLGAVPQILDHLHRALVSRVLSCSTATESLASATAHTSNAQAASQYGSHPSGEWHKVLPFDEVWEVVPTASPVQLSLLDRPLLHMTACAKAREK